MSRSQTLSSARGSSREDQLSSELAGPAVVGDWWYGVGEVGELGGWRFVYDTYTYVDDRLR